MCRTVSLGLLACWLSLSGVALAEEAITPTVDEIVRRANHAAYYEGKDGRANVSMTIIDDQGRQRQRSFTILRRNDDGEGDAGQKFYVYFHRPADVKDMVFLVWKHLDKDDDRWLYLPALDLVKRIAASDKRTSFVGSHFFYEDVSGRRIDEDEHELVEVNDNYYVLKNVPKHPDTVEFKYYIAYIHRGTFLPVSIAYYDDQDTKYRVYTATKVEMIQGHATVTGSEMADLRTNSKTVLEYSNVAYDIGLPEDIFTDTERYLRQPPRKYLR